MKEQSLHQQIVDYIKYQYPKVLFRTDFAAGIKMSIGQAIKHKKLQKCKAWPDLFIAEPIGDFKGLFIELKIREREVFLKDGRLVRSSHIEQQLSVLIELQYKGYYSIFGFGFDHTKKVIDNYLNGLL